MKRIVCPICGVVGRYFIKETVTRGLLYNAQGEPEGQTEDVCIYSGKVKRCLKCMRKIEIVGDDESSEE